MPANVYECLFILDTTKVAGDQNAAFKTLQTLLERNHGEVLATRAWMEHKFAYPIKGQRKGLYYLVYFRTDSQNLSTLTHDLSLVEMVLRHLVVRIEPKFVEKMLSLVNEENVAYQAVHEPPPEDDLGGDRGGRRGFGGGRRFEDRRPAEVGGGKED